MLLDIVPSTKIQRIKSICDNVYGVCARVFETKREAIKQGDKELLHMVGEGKDVMSILCKVSSTTPAWSDAFLIPF